MNLNDDDFDRLFKKTIKDYDNNKNDIRTMLDTYQSIIAMFYDNRITHEQVSEINRVRDSIEAYFDKYHKQVNPKEFLDLKNQHERLADENKKLYDQLKNCLTRYHKEVEDKKHYKAALLVTLTELKENMY